MIAGALVPVAPFVIGHSFRCIDCARIGPPPGGGIKWGINWGIRWGITWGIKRGITFLYGGGSGAYLVNKKIVVNAFSPFSR
jgi:hypothetical protein